MDVSAARRVTRRPAARGSSETIVWHDLECGAYRADLPLWHELARRSGGPILEIGAGTGRVALDLARAGHDVTALDLDGDLLEALGQRAPGTSVPAIRADARSFELGRRDFGLCIAAMQTVQLLGGRAERIAFMTRVRAHLRADGLLACAIVTAPESFDCAGGAVGPAPETRRLDGLLYISRVVRVVVDASSVLIEREQQVLHAAEPPQGPAARIRAAPPAQARREAVELHRVGVGELESEAVQVGFQPCRAREVPGTAEHVGSAVVMLRA